MQHRMNLVAMTWTRVVTLMATLLFVTGCAAGATPLPTTAPTVQAKNPEAVLRAITEALNNKDAEAATALLADNVMQTLIPAPSGTGIYQGKDALQARFKEVVAANPTHTLTSCQTSGDEVICAATYSDDSTKPLGFALEFTVDAIVQDGLLKTVTWKMSDASLAKMQAALANPQPQAIALTFVKDKCTFGGPRRVSAGEMTVNIKAESGAYYGLFIATFDKGKTLNDLNGLPVSPQPDWVHEVDKVEFSTDRTIVTTVRQGPIYLICFNLTGEWTLIGKFGPIEVDEAPASPTPSKDPESVLKAITEALNKKDVEAATALLANDVTQTLIPAPSGTGVYQGKDALRARFKEVVAGNPVHTLTGCQTNDDKVTCMATYSDDSTKPLGFDLEFNVEAVVQNGLLKTVTWKMTDQSLAKLQAAMASKPTPTFTPPVLASSVNDIIGVWHFGCNINDVHVEYKVDGTSVFTLALPSTPGVAPVAFQNKYTFDSGTIKWTGPCTGSDPTKSCTAVYKIYVIKQDSKIAKIKYELISDEDKGGSRSCLPGRIAARVEP